MQSDLHVGLKDAKSTPSSRLCLVERHIGVPEERIAIDIRTRGDRDADTCAYFDLAMTKLIRRAEGIDDALSLCGCRGRQVSRRIEDREFITTKTRDEIGTANTALQPSGRDLQKRVTCGVSERIIDQLEPVEVQVQQCQIISVRRQLPQGIRHLAAEQHSVWQMGKRVMMRQEADARLCLLALCDILIGGYPAAIGQWTLRHGQSELVVLNADE